MLFRSLGKISHANPAVVFNTILAQIQGYDNLIVPVVDMMKYASPMSYDVLSYVILTQLASPSKERLKEDGLNVSLWMQSLSSFCGNLYKKYPSVELVGLLQYVANTLKSGQSLQLLLLRDLVTKMSGIEVLEDISHEQLLAQAGGETLRNVVTDLLGIAKNTKKSSTRLKDSLVKHELVMPLFLLIAQQRSACAYTTDTPHLKMLGELYDRCQETLEQFVAFVSSNVTPAEYAQLLRVKNAMHEEIRKSQIDEKKSKTEDPLVAANALAAFARPSTEEEGSAAADTSPHSEDPPPDKGEEVIAQQVSDDDDTEATAGTESAASASDSASVAATAASRAIQDAMNTVKQEQHVLAEREEAVKRQRSKAARFCAESRARRRLRTMIFEQSADPATQQLQLTQLQHLQQSQIRNQQLQYGVSVTDGAGDTAREEEGGVAPAAKELADWAPTCDRCRGTRYL